MTVLLVTSLLACLVLLVLLAKTRKDLQKTKTRMQQKLSELEGDLKYASSYQEAQSMQMSALYNFVNMFVYDDVVRDHLRPLAVRLDVACRDAIEAQKTTDLEKVQDGLAQRTRRVNEAKKAFWDAVAVANSVNKVLFLRKLEIPKSYKELLPRE